jgi:hypothetical protein
MPKQDIKKFYMQGTSMTQTALAIEISGMSHMKGKGYQAKGKW